MDGGEGSCGPIRCVRPKDAILCNPLPSRRLATVLQSLRSLKRTFLGKLIGSMYDAFDVVFRRPLGKRPCQGDDHNGKIRFRAATLKCKLIKFCHRAADAACRLTLTLVL